MILKVWDTNPDHKNGWVYFDHIEKVRIVKREKLGKEEEIHCGGGFFADCNEESGFNVADVERAWGMRDLGENTTIAFQEGYLLGDDGRTIERL